MLSSQSIQLIFSSWDIIKHTPNYQEVFSHQMSEKLADSAVAEWFSGPSNPHHVVFVKMIDLIVHLLGPDLDVIIEELTSQGRRHHRYNSDMLGFFSEEVFAEVADAFIATLQALMQEEAAKEAQAAAAAVEDHILHPAQLEPVTKAWSDIFTMIRAIMKQGIKIEVRRHKKRAEKHRQELLSKQDRRSSGSTKSMSESSSSEAESDVMIPTTATAPKRTPSFGRGQTSKSSRTSRRPKVPSSRGVGRTVSANLPSLATSFRSTPMRSRSGIRGGKKLGKFAGLSRSNHNSSGNNDGEEKSKLAHSSEGRAPKRGLRPTMSMKRLQIGRRKEL